MIQARSLIPRLSLIGYTVEPFGPTYLTVVTRGGYIIEVYYWYPNSQYREVPATYIGVLIKYVLLYMRSLAVAIYPIRNLMA